MAVPFAVMAIGGSGADVGYVAAAATVPVVVFLLWGGVIADRLPRHKLIVAADLLQAVAQAGSAALVLTGRAAAWEPRWCSTRTPVTAASTVMGARPAAQRFTRAQQAQGTARRYGPGAVVAARLAAGRGWLRRSGVASRAHSSGSRPGRCLRAAGRLMRMV